MSVDITELLREASKYKPIWCRVETVEEFIFALFCGYPIYPGPFTASEVLPK